MTVDTPVTPPISIQPDWDKLTIEKSADSTGSVKPGDTVTYTIKVINNTGMELTNVSVLETLDANLTLVSANPAEQYNAGNGIWTISAIANGQTVTITIKATVNSGVADRTVIQNTATIIDATADGGNLPDRYKIRDNADVTVTNPQIEPDPVEPVEPAEPTDPPKATEPTDSPKTGDNSNMMMLWIALFVSGNAFVGMILYGRKRRVSDK